MEAMLSSETSVYFNQTIWRNILEDGTFHAHVKLISELDVHGHTNCTKCQNFIAN
jgi:hypothetical protein